MLPPAPSACWSTTFPSALGECGLVWSDRGLTGVLLPQPSVRSLRAELARRGRPVPGDRAPRWVRRAAERLARHLAGRCQDLSDLPVVLDGAPPFSRRVYELLRRTPPGQTRSYGELARQLGSPGAARAVGQAMARNPLPIVVPCHRVLGARGGLGGFSAAGGTETKRRLLQLEGVAERGRLFEGEAELPYDGARARRVLGRAEPALGRLIEQVGPLRLRRELPRSTFAALAEAIVYQQLTMRAGATIYRRLRAEVSPGGKAPALTAKAVLAAPDEALRRAGLSGAKAAALRDLAARTRARQVPSVGALERMSDEAIVEALTAIRGIGPWTVQMLLIFGLGRPDVLPASDYALRKGYAVVFRCAELPSPSELAARGERWRPYRSVAAWYLWRAADLGAGG